LAWFAAREAAAWDFDDRSARSHGAHGAQFRNSTIKQAPPGGLDAVRRLAFAATIAGLNWLRKKCLSDQNCPAEESWQANPRRTYLNKINKLSKKILRFRIGTHLAKHWLDAKRSRILLRADP
jgi:hypothetical protein|tara:strand:+ start:266 stop:634 length:369 start_codon:yes stop_codon:yes gene_type:complete